MGSPYLGKLPVVVLGFRVWALALRDVWTFGTGLSGFRVLGLHGLGFGLRSLGIYNFLSPRPQFEASVGIPTEGGFQRACSW